MDAVAIFTQRWMHGPWPCERSLRASMSTRRFLWPSRSRRSGPSLRRSRDQVDVHDGRDSFYYPAAIFCRQRMRSRAVGSFVYGEGEYLHDMDHGFYEAYRYSGGEGWKATASFPPMFYPTHSVSGILSVIGAHAVTVSCLGYRDTANDGVFDAAVSRWGNEFNNEIALFRTSDGGAMRICEMRRIGRPNVEPNVRFSLFGTKGSFEQQTGASMWATGDSFEDVTALLQTHAHLQDGSIPEDGASPEDGDLAHIPRALRWGFRSGFAAVHDRSALPPSFVALPNGHEGSHQFLVHDFVVACIEGTIAPVNAWVAARYTLPGLIAHESAVRGGELLPIPDFGDPPLGAPAVTVPAMSI